MANLHDSATFATVPHAAWDAALNRHHSVTRPRLDRLWRYYRNPLPMIAERTRARSAGQGLPAQAAGLPARLLDAPSDPSAPPRERVIENDIAWRVHALVDFMVPGPIQVRSLASNPEQAREIETFLHGVFDRSGGAAFFQDLALLGSVYGHIDLLVDADPDQGLPRLQMVPAPRGVAVTDPADFRRVLAYLVHVQQPAAGEPTQRWRRWLPGSVGAGGASQGVTTVFTEQTVERFVSDRPGRLGRRVASSVNPLGRVPVVHIQNLSQPYHWPGLSDVEPLIPLQDELNTRLSDRANRVTFQSFKMYLGKGIERFTDRPVGPGQMWQTDNPDAAIQEFGGDAASPSEESHIRMIPRSRPRPFIGQLRRLLTYCLIPAGVAIACRLVVSPTATEALCLATALTHLTRCISWLIKSSSDAHAAALNGLTDFSRSGSQEGRMSTSGIHKSGRNPQRLPRAESQAPRRDDRRRPHPARAIPRPSHRRHPNRPPHARAVSRRAGVAAGCEPSPRRLTSDP